MQGQLVFMEARSGVTSDVDLRAGIADSLVMWVHIGSCHCQGIMGLCSHGVTGSNAMEIDIPVRLLVQSRHGRLAAT